MQLNETIANQIVQRSMKIINYSVNVMDSEGRIIGSGDPNRLYQKHEGAVLSINECRTVEIDDAMASRLKGVKPGINLPIVHHEDVLGVVGISGEPSAVHRYGELVKMTAELIVEQAELMEQIQWDKRHREELVLQLISGKHQDINKLETIAQRLGIDIQQPRIAAIIKLIPRKKQAVTLEHMQHLVHLLEFPERNNLVGILSVSDHEVVVLKPASVNQQKWDPNRERQRIKQLLKRIDQEAEFKIKMAVGDYFATPLGLSQSFQTAQTTLQISRHLPGNIFFFEDHQLPVLLNALEYDSWQRDRLLSPLIALTGVDKNGQLETTLRRYFDSNCDLNMTCESLHIHRNTLRYRLDKIKTATGLDINNLEDKIHLYLALSISQ